MKTKLIKKPFKKQSDMFYNLLEGTSTLALYYSLLMLCYVEGLFQVAFNINHVIYKYRYKTILIQSEKLLN